MATTKNVDATKAGVLAQRIVEFLINEESDTQQHAMQAAFTLLGYGNLQSRDDHPQTFEEVRDVEDLTSFFDREGDYKPADHANLCAAYHFAQFGMTAFTISEIREIALNAGVVVPDRLDKTFTSAMKKGKKIFQSAGKGTFKPTTAGCLIFRERWGVKPGRKAKTPSNTQSMGMTNAKAR